MCLSTRKGTTWTARAIELLHYPPCQQYSVGHYAQDNAELP